MRVRGAAGLWALAACGPLLLLAGGVLALSVDPAPLSSTTFIENVYPNIVFGSVLPLLGALILTRVPGHPIGLIFLACGLVCAATLPVYSYGRVALYGHHGLPLGVPVAWVSSWLWALGFLPLVTIGVLLFPDGRLPSRRWRALMVSDVVALGVIVASAAFAPGPLANHTVRDNPLGLPVSDRAIHLATGFGMVLFFLGMIGGAAATVVRWRRADAAGRAQLNWFALAVLLIVVGIGLFGPLTLIAVPLLPLAVTIAILRRDLYGINVVVHRSLVYGTLTALLLAGYGFVVTLLGALVSDRTSIVVALVATALVAVAFAPLRARLQRSVDRLLYGESDDPYAVLTGLGRRLEQPLADPDSVLADVAEAVAESLRLPYVRVEMSADGVVLAGAEAGSPRPELHEVPLTFRGEAVGRLLAAPRSPHDPFRPADLRLLDDLGRQIGVAVHAMRLALDLQRSREGLVAMREEERRRIRRDLHDGLGPALAGVALGLDAVQRIVPPGAEGAADLAGQLKVEVQQSLADVRRLVEDLRPPDLDQLGLVGALRHQAGKVTERDPGLVVEVAGDDLPQLPAAVEVAAYRIATEALTNVGRHAAARRCRISLAMDDPDRLRVEIEDDGVGLRNRRPGGVGLTAMRERATELGGSFRVCRREQGGTLVTARLPVGVS